MNQTQPTSISIAIADDHEIFRMGMKQLLGQMANIEFIFEAMNGQDFLNKIDTIGVPNLGIMDINMPILNGIETVKALKGKHVDTKIIALTSDKNTAHFVEMVKLNVHGFMLKTASAQEIQNAIQLVSNGAQYISNDLFDTITEAIADKNDKQSKFSRRETEILDLIGKGLDTKDIAKKLYISQRTIEKHKSNMMAKTNSHNNVQLILYAIRNGLISL